MRDYNFFSVYIDDKNTEKKKRMYGVALGVILASLVTGIISYNYIRIKDVKQDIAGIERFINNEKMVKDNNNIISKELTIKSMIEYSELVDGIESELDLEYLKYMSVLDTIGSSIPDKVYISQLDINRDVAMIYGTTSDKAKVAYFQHNLRNQSPIKNVTVSVIHNDEDQKTYSYNIQCYFKDVIENEGN